MTAAHARAARRERQAAALLGSRRVHRARYERAPDVEPVRLADGTVVVAESKTRKALPRWLVGAVAQARAYLPGCVPLVVLSELGGEPLAALPLRDLVRLLGLRRSDIAAAQLTIAPVKGGRF
ncbi:MAG: hypothetical protein JOZ69_01360 [Myxococcales bacterium]|nr:hypothetical protein [Myxococcales bacterium]